MNETEQVSQLIGEIYDASLDPSLWQGVLQAIASFIPVSGVNLFAQDAMKKSANVFYVHGLDPAYIQSYFDKYIKMNPLFPATLFFEQRKDRADHIDPLTVEIVAQPADAKPILPAVLYAVAEILTHDFAHMVAIEKDGSLFERFDPLIERPSDGCLARPGQTDKPDHHLDFSPI